MNRTIAAVAAFASVSAAVAATVSIIPAANLPSNAARVGFESLPSNSTTPLTTYTENGMTITSAWLYPGSVYGALASSVNTKYLNTNSLYFPTGATQVSLFSFSQPVSQISLLEYGALMSSLTLFTDSAGSQSLGTFNVTHSTATYPDLFAFESDTPFRSFTYTLSFGSSYAIDDLRYANAVPEPSALIAGLGALTAYFGLQRRRRA